MLQFASLEDYEARYGAVTDSDRVETLLEDASYFLALELNNSKKEYDPENELQAAALMRITCRLAHDLVDTPVDMAGVSQSSVTVGAFSNSWTFSNPTGAFKLLPSERKQLGVGRVRVGSVEPMVHDV